MILNCSRCGAEWFARPSLWKGGSYDWGRRCPRCWRRGGVAAILKEAQKK